MGDIEVDLDDCQHGHEQELKLCYYCLKADRDRFKAEVERLREKLEQIVNGGYSGASFLAHEVLVAREEVGRA